MSALLDLAVKATMLVACAGIAVAHMRRASASSRHLVWTGAFCAIAVLPVARLTLPDLKIAVFAAPAPAPPAPATDFTPQLVNVDGAAVILDASTVRIEAVTPVPSPRRSLTAGEIAIGIWAFGVVALITRAVAGWIALRRTVRQATAVSDPRVLARFEAAQARFRVRRHIQLLRVDEDGLPCTFGVRRPVILLPKSLLVDDASVDARLDAVLSHELAHIARFDALADIIIRAGAIAHWFNPLMWIGARLARVERERAADDAVLAGGTKASDYARELVEIASQSSPRPWHVIPMAASALERRIRAILDERVKRGGYSRVSLVVALVLPAMMLPLSAAKLVARAPVVVESQTPEISALESLNALTPRIAQTPQATPQSIPAPKTWDADRDAMLHQVLDAARTIRKDTQARIEIGTTASRDVLPLDAAILRIEANLARGPAALLAPVELAAVRSRFERAWKNLEAERIRYDNGLRSTAEITATVMAALTAVTDSPVVIADRGAHGALVFPALDGRGREFFFFNQQEVAPGVAILDNRTTLPDLAGSHAFTAGIAAQSPRDIQVKGANGWDPDRAAMLRQVLDRARKFRKDAQTKVEIGTAAAIDTAQFQMMTETVEATFDRGPKSSTPLTPAELSAVKARFEKALKNVDAVAVRFDNGLAPDRDVIQSLNAALSAIVDPPLAGGQINLERGEELSPSARALYDLLTGRAKSINEKPPEAAQLSDAELLTALRAAPGNASEQDRADALIALAQRYAFSTEMVSAWVAAANSIKTETIRAKVFAQSIRVKGGL